MQIQYVSNPISFLFRRFISFLLPPRCLVTGDPVEALGLLSSTAWQQLRFVTRPYCGCCGIPFEVEMCEDTLCIDCLQTTPAYVRARAPLVYDDASKPIILAFKHNDKLEAVVSIAPLMLSVFDDLQARIDIVMPVPLHWRRLLQRRYNQSALLAKAIGKQKNIELIVDGLSRTENTQTQGGKKRDERIANVKNAFAVPQKYTERIKGKSILLVDDVMTTGATVNECAQTLIHAGASSVYVLCVARVLKSAFQVPDLGA